MPSNASADVKLIQARTLENGMPGRLSLSKAVHGKTHAPETAQYVCSNTGYDPQPEVQDPRS